MLDRKLLVRRRQVTRGSLETQWKSLDDDAGSVSFQNMLGIGSFLTSICSLCLRVCDLLIALAPIVTSCRCRDVSSGVCLPRKLISAALRSSKKVETHNWDTEIVS